VDAPQARRIVVLGCAGSGKTTLGRKLSDAIGARFVCLDAIWQRSWSDADVPRFRELLETAHADESWVSDGNFAQATFDIRLARAELVVWLDRPRLGCAWRAVTRVFQSGEAHRPQDVSKVISFIWNFDRINRPRIEAARLRHGPNVPVVKLSSSAEIAQFLKRRTR